MTVVHSHSATAKSLQSEHKSPALPENLNASKNSPKISLIIPAYNEAQRLGPFLASVAKYIHKHSADIYEVIVVDDGSTDQTVAVAKKFSNRLPLRIVQHQNNRGKGAAVKTGVTAATGDYIIFIDADGATDIAEIPRMTHALKASQIGIGNRWMKGAKTEQHSSLRQLSSLVYRTYLGLFGLGGIDTMCGFKGYHRSVATDLFTDLQEERWLFDTEIAYKAVRRGYTINNFPIRWEDKAGSKLSTAELLNSAWQIWPLLRRIKRNENIRK